MTAFETIAPGTRPCVHSCNATGCLTRSLRTIFCPIRGMWACRL
ncbi:hypothetical protein NGA_0492200 [Nannochloropsis gaditana CCMP526]|nr:hypothetical protein NGA_0492200 [Nannochloropsis gaditana CCMP526]EKU22346.1 hypothetical protein NGA_0492200 [Nannochloropsis gaditana CCMP526]|eukprot:XP_005854017.1 hypothetical protein NGA_0492200 [Nannochloropsis gaditana CCMP526]